jgi:hypothetical protein
MHPSPEQIDDWIGEVLTPNKPGRNSVHRDHAYGCCIHVARQAYAAGADAQLEACEKWVGLSMPNRYVESLHAAMRPNPPSLKQQALELMETLGAPTLKLDAGQCETIRRALEALPDD